MLTGGGDSGLIIENERKICLTRIHPIFFSFFFFNGAERVFFLLLLLLFVCFGCFSLTGDSFIILISVIFYASS